MVSNRFLIIGAALLGIAAASAWWLAVPHFTAHEEEQAHRAGFSSAQKANSLTDLAKKGDQPRNFSEAEFNKLAEALHHGTNTEKIYALSPFQHAREYAQQKRVVELVKPYLLTDNLKYQIYDVLYSYAESAKGRSLVEDLSKDSNPAVASQAKQILHDAKPSGR